MTDAVPDRLPELWFEYRRRAHGTRDQRKALSLGRPAEVQGAEDWVDDRVMDGGTRAIDVIVLLAEAAVSEDQLAAVGIGPVETLIYTDGEVIVGPLIDRARHSPALAAALSWVSLAIGTVSDESLARLSEYRRAH